MKGIGTITLAVLLGLTACLSSAAPQQKKKPAPKPKAPSTAPTMGTVQMAGDNGKLGVIYQLGRKDSELHFTLESAAFATSYPTPEEIVVAGAKQRLLVLTFTAQNPQKTEMSLDYSSFKFTVVSPDDQNIDYSGYMYNANTKAHVSQRLKPAQKLKCTAVIPIYAEGPVPKLIVARDNAPVLRYELTDKVAKLKTQFSPDGVDLKDNGGVLPIGTPIEMGPYKITIDKIYESKDELKGFQLGSENKFFFVTATVENIMAKPVSIGWQYFSVEPATGSGLKIRWGGYLIASDGPETVSMEMSPGDKAQVRFLFQISDTVKPKTVKFMHGPTSRFVTLEVPAAGH